MTETSASKSILQCLKPRRQLFTATRQQQNVFFYHPGYQDGHDLLLSLPALDAGGIHHETARIACAILAACRFDGYFSTSKNGPKIPDRPDDILQNKKYYFCIEDGIKYPIVPSFDNFQCPRELPESWLGELAPIEPGVYRDARERDNGCRITGSSLPTELAHIIPQAQSEWWQKNLMYTYVANPDESFDAKCPDNTLLLRCDMHKMWDDNRFAILPKAGGWYTHMLLNSNTTELEQEYHNLQLQPLRGVSRHFLFCRFAFAILAKSAFLRQRIRRKLVILDDRSGSSKVREMSVDEYKELISLTARGTSRSTSPTKRQRRDQSESNLQEEIFADAEISPGDELKDDAEGESTRGRPRKRPGSPAML
ncbi:HNH endonuclease domain containing protein, partial [Fusarium agapanthi]